MFNFFTNDGSVELFKREFLLKILENYLRDEECSEVTFSDSDLRVISLDILEDRKFLIPYKRWKSLQTSEDPVIQNIFWNVCNTKNLAHHEIRDGINEVNENLRAQGNNLDKFIFVELDGSYCCFWLHTQIINKKRIFNATVMILPRIGDLFGFDKNGNCIHI
jgi:hypothetical protein